MPFNFIDGNLSVVHFQIYIIITPQIPFDFEAGWLTSRLICLMHPDSSSATELFVSYIPQTVPPPSFLYNKFHSDLLSCPNWIPRGPPSVPLRPSSLAIYHNVLLILYPMYI